MAGIETNGLFPPADEAEWRRLVERALDGRPFESLITATFEGLNIAPLYPRALREGGRALRQKPGAWTISQRMDHPGPETANLMARADLDGGADALTLCVTPAISARGFGVRIETRRDLDAALANIDLDRIALRLDAGARTLDLAPFFVSLARDRRLTSAVLDVDFGHDPYGHFARSGRLPEDPAGGLREMHLAVRGAGFTGHLLLADGRPYHEAGAGEAQELACVIATGAEYLRLLEEEEIPLEEARAEIAFLLAAAADALLSLAKFRALRRLWARVESACGLTPEPLRLHAETAFRMMTRYDPWVNIMRATMGAFCAGIGGADAITVLPFTLALGLPDAFARRIARNTQLILIHESSLARVADPAAGAGSFEALTHALCEKAWRLFQSFEARGGMLKALQDGGPQQEIGRAATARQAAIADGALAITGTSAFPFLAETPVAVLAPSPDQAREISAAKALPSLRDAEPYEKLRAASDGHFHKTGVRPKIFLAHLGEPQGSAFILARNFFAAAGLEAMAQEGCDNSPATESFRASGCKIACLCASGAVSPAALRETARTLRAAGAARIYLAGQSSKETATALLDAGAVNDLIGGGSNTLAILQDAAATALHEQPSST